MEVTDVTVSIIKTVDTGVLHLFEQVATIKDGEGTVERALQGGPSTVTIRLKRGKETPAYSLHDGEGVIITGTVSGSVLSYPGLFTTFEAQRHNWKFFSRFGSPG